MSKQTNTLTRRKFLKGAAYTSALSMGSLSSLASAKSATASATGSTSLKQRVNNGSGLLAINLSNQSDQTVALNARQPVSLEKVNGWVVVKINKASTPHSGEIMTGQHIHLTAGQQCSFAVDAELAPMLTAGSTDIVAALILLSLMSTARLIIWCQ